MAHRKENEPLYKTIHLFIDRCMLSNQSLLWPEKAYWTLANVKDIKRRMYDSPIFGGEFTFEEKLQKQLDGASSELWGIICDLYYIYFLPSDSIRLEKKKSDLQRTMALGNLIEPKEDIWEPQRHGFTRTSQKYHYKYSQFWLIILLANHVKELPSPREVFNSPDILEHTLDSILESIPQKTDRAYDMRHALLNMAFPDEYERIISTGDKRKIVQAYGIYNKDITVGGLDSSLRAIRESKEKEYASTDRPFDFYDHKEEWRGTEEGPKPSTLKGDSLEKTASKKKDTTKIMDSDLVAILQGLSNTHNIILYGPPGTGKTYLAVRAASELIEPQLNTKLSEKAAILQAIQDLTFYDILALSLFSNGPDKRYTVADIVGQSIITTRVEAYPVAHPREYIWGTLQSHTSPESKTVKVARRGEPYLFDKYLERGESVWALTEDGKEYIQTRFPETLGIIKSSHTVSASAEQFIVQTTFHQSYSYEDFIEGIRPREDETSGEITYPVVPGIFRKICQQALADPGNKYVLVIDEINRGNIAKIFGELITTLEEDKRGYSVVLQYSGDRFSVPENLFILGTMNSTDRSIALLDVALRRRFAFIELMPRLDLLKDQTVDFENISISLLSLMENLNKKIVASIGRDYQIGHSYLLKVAEKPIEKKPSFLEFVWNRQIMPLLQEYFYSQPEKLQEILGQPWIEDASELANESDQIGSKQLIGDELLAALEWIANGWKE